VTAIQPITEGLGTDHRGCPAAATAHRVARAALVRVPGERTPVSSDGTWGATSGEVAAGRGGGQDGGIRVSDF
jgi:hypothetical protein